MHQTGSASNCEEWYTIENGALGDGVWDTRMTQYKHAVPAAPAQSHWTTVPNCDCNTTSANHDTMIKPPQCNNRLQMWWATALSNKHDAAVLASYGKDLASWLPRLTTSTLINLWPFTKLNSIIPINNPGLMSNYESNVQSRTRLMATDCKMVHRSEHTSFCTQPTGLGYSLNFG